jgi:voltage-gated potassium channel Kch
MSSANDITRALHAAEWEGHPVFWGGRASDPGFKVSAAWFDRTFFHPGSCFELVVMPYGEGARATVAAQAGFDHRDRVVIATSDDITTPEELLAWARMVANLTQG